MVGSILPVTRGLSAPAVTGIPEQWDRTWFRNFITNFLVNADIRNVVTPAGSGIVISGNVSGNATTGSGTTVTLSQSPVANNTVMGNVSGGSAVPSALTQTQLTALVNSFTSTLSGVVPASGGGIVKFLRADTSFAIPPTFTSTTPGYVPLSGGGTTTFLRADGTFAVPPGSLSSANPAASVGLTTVNGSAATFMRSDAAPPIDQSIVPTWTGAHTFNAGLTSTTVNATSDPKLKSNIRKIEDSDSILDGINGYRFDWIKDDSPSMGVMSTEIKAVAPELIHTAGKHEAVNYNGLIAVLIEEIKSLKQRVKELEK